MFGRKIKNLQNRIAQLEIRMTKVENNSEIPAFIVDEGGKNVLGYNEYGYPMYFSTNNNLPEKDIPMKKKLSVSLALGTILEHLGLKITTRTPMITEINSVVKK